MDEILDEQALWFLGLDTCPTARVLKSAFRSAIRKWHPDRYADDPVAEAAAVERAKQINAAFERLSRQVVSTRA